VCSDSFSGECSGSSSDRYNDRDSNKDNDKDAASTARNTTGVWMMTTMTSPSLPNLTSKCSVKTSSSERLLHCSRIGARLRQH
jgi:hypothetical protein